MEITPPAVDLEVGQTVQLAATTKAADGTILNRAVRWTSEDTSVVAVSASGFVRANREGTAAVSAESGGVSAVASVTVTARTVVLIWINTSAVDLEIGETAQLEAEPRAGDGTPLDRPVTWTSENPFIAVVSNQGLVSASSAGTALVTASSESASVSVRVTVVPSADGEFDVVLHPGQDLQAIIAQQPAGTVFGFQPGVYELAELEPKDDMEFVGGPDVVLDGMNQARFAFSGAAAGLHLKDLEITRYEGLNDDHAAIHGWDGRDWVLEDLYVHHNRTSGASVRNGALIVGGRFNHNGQLGIAVNETRNVVVRGAEIAYNNEDGRYAPLVAAGGIKISVSQDVTVEDSFVHDNFGPGIWYDADCANGRILNNTVESNAYAGVFYEISTDALIEGNTIRDNGTPSVPWHGAGVLISTAANVTVRANVLSGNAHGVLGLDEGRRPYGVSGTLVELNEIDMDGGFTGIVDLNPDGKNATTDLGNVFRQNSYTLHERPEPFYDATRRVSWDAWRQVGQDVGSQVVG